MWFAVLTPSQGLEQRLDADVKEARILLAGRHGRGGCVATVTDSRGRTGRQDATEGREGAGRERERGMRVGTAGDADVASLCCRVRPTLCVRMCTKPCVCVSKRMRQKKRQSASSALCVAILLANAPHPLSVLLSQDSDTQMLVDANSQSSERKKQERERKTGREGGMQ